MALVHTAAAPVRVRGKRGARPEEKWNFGKRRDPTLQHRRLNTATYGHRPSLAEHDPTPLTRSRKRRRRRRHIPQSSLEALPPEVLQTIFAYSTNIALPLTSTQLASKLCNSMQLRYELSDCLLKPVIGTSGNVQASLADLSSATRLLNSRFMDLPFFKMWLRSRFSEKMQLSYSSGDPSEHVDWHALWDSCEPSRTLLPPRKLLSFPTSPEKTSFLSILTKNIDDVASLDASYGELAYESLFSAVQQPDNFEYASVLLSMGVHVSTELLRAAVAESPSFDRTLVQKIVLQPGSIDLLDPIVWSWAGKAHEDGEWLMDLLRRSQEQLHA